MISEIKGISYWFEYTENFYNLVINMGYMYTNKISDDIVLSDLEIKTTFNKMGINFDIKFYLFNIIITYFLYFDYKANSSKIFWITFFI